MVLRGVLSSRGLNGVRGRCPLGALAVVGLSALALSACDAPGREVNPGAGGDAGGWPGGGPPHGIVLVPDAGHLAPTTAGAVGVFEGASPDAASEVRWVDFSGDTVATAAAPEGVTPRRLIPATPDGVLLLGAEDTVTRLDQAGGVVWTWEGPESGSDPTAGAPLPISLASAAAAGDSGGGDQGWVLVGTVGDDWDRQGAYVARLDSGGQTTWEVTVGAGDHAGGMCAAVAPDGGVFVGGTSRYPPAEGATYPDGSQIPDGASFQGAYVAALAGDTGGVLWETALGDPQHPDTGPFEVAALLPDGQGGVYVGGSTMETEMYVTHFDGQGQQGWLKTYQVGGHAMNSMSYLTDMAPAGDGDLMLAGWGHAADVAPDAGFAAHVAQVGRVAADGTLVFLKTYANPEHGPGPGGLDRSYDLEASRITPCGGGFLVTGGCQCPSEGREDLLSCSFLMGISPDGEVL